MDYQHFDAKDFATDEYFQQWVLLPDNTNDHFWQTWMQEHPEQKDMVEQARKTVLMLGYRERSIYAKEIESVKAKVFREINRTPQEPSHASVVVVRPLTPKWYWLAASLTGILMLTMVAWLFVRNSQYTTYATGYGEIKEFYLPDSSLVVLNANSALKYSTEWEEAGTRKVWLEGEAFFHVKKRMLTEDDKSADVTGFAKFIVYADAIAVEVLGTEFNVNHREDQTEVTLKSGKVKLAVQNGSGEEIEMQPGDLVEFAQQSQSVKKTTVDPTTRIAWKDHLMVFDHLTLQEIADRLEDTYGVQIVFEDAALAKEQFKGFVPADNLDMLLKAFSKLYNLKISREGQTLIFHRVTEETG